MSCFCYCSVHDEKPAFSLNVPFQPDSPSGLVVPHFPPLGGLLQDLLSKFHEQCVVLSSMQSVQRCLSVTTNVTLVHQVCGKFHQPAQYPYTMFQRSVWSSGLARHEHRTLDDPIGPPNGGLSRTVWLLAPECESVVPKLVDELRCSLSNSGKCRSSSWNQHRPCAASARFPTWSYCPAHNNHSRTFLIIDTTQTPRTLGPSPPPHKDTSFQIV